MNIITRKTALIAVALIVAWSAPAGAQSIRGRVIVVPRGPIYAPFTYDPFWGPYYPYAVYPYAVYPYVSQSTADVRVQVTPKQAAVYVDGYYAGVAGDFDGVFKRLHTTPGGHAITLYLEGYRTITENIYVRPDATFKMQETLEKLAPGEASVPPPSPDLPPR